jgi:hypothetical protein
MSHLEPIKNEDSLASQSSLGEDVAGISCSLVRTTTNLIG